MMYAESLVPQLTALANRAAQSEGVDVAWVELKRKGGGWVFRVFIEREDGSVGLAECERVGSRLGLLLDIEDPIEESYCLEVSTPGLDRPLRTEKDYVRFTGRLAMVKTKMPLDGRRSFVGRLAGVREGILQLEEEERTHDIPLSSIEKGRLEVELSLPIPTRKARKRA